MIKIKAIKIYSIILKSILLAVMLSSSPTSRAQEYQFTFLTADHGLTNMNITNIHQDKYGFMWIGTEDGLSFYDGYNFINFRNEPSNPNSISNNFIHSIAEDNDGNIWIGTHKGINIYNRELNLFVRFIADPTDNESLSHNEVNKVYIDSKNQLWAGTANGLNFLIPGTKKFKRYQNDPHDTTSIEVGNIDEIHEDYRGQLWIGSRKRLSIMNPDGSFTNIKSSDKSKSPNSPYITSIFEDRENNLYIGTFNGIIYKFDIHTREYTTLPFQFHNIDDINETTDDQLIIATNVGLNILNKELTQVTQLTHSDEDAYSLNSNIISKIFFDRNERMWLGTRFGGINLYDKNRNDFKHIKNNRLDKYSLSGNNVTSFAEGEQGNFFVGVDGAGLNYYDKKKGTFKRFSSDPSSEIQLSNDKVLALKTDSEGGLWIGYWSGALDYYNTKTGKHKRYKHNPEKKGSLSDNNIFYIFEDSKKNIWIGTWGKGLNKYNKETDDFTSFTNNPQDPGSLGSTYAITHIAEDHQGYLWISMEMGGGLDMFDPTTGNFTHYKAGQEPGDLSSNALLVVYEDSEKRLWVGTNGGGLNLFDRKTKTFKKYLLNDGLPDETIVGILEDNDKNLWLSTFSGISKFNPDRNTFKNFSVGDGLQSKQFNRWASLRLSSGEMLFGGINGFNLFNPEKIKENTYIPPVYITDFKLFNKALHVGENEVLQKNIFSTDEIKLNYDQNFFSFEFTALNYIQPEKNQFKYIMEGLQKEWSEAGPDRKVSYTNLDPGSYVFKVIGSNNDDLWNTEGAQVKITIAPPYWQTWWFRIFVVLLIIGSAIAWYKNRITSIKQQKLLLEQQVFERTAEVVAQKELLEAQTEYLQDANWEIINQGQKLEKVYSEVKDSIRAAQVIQQSILPSVSKIKQHLPESFIYYKPKDVVSGDFYWFDVKDGNIIIACVDCTGHGVSGAFMSISGHHLLNQAIYPFDKLVASEILDRLNKGLIGELQIHEGCDSVYDGMDISICIIRNNKKSLQYAGANNPLYILRNKEIIQVKANKFPIGISINGETKKFTNQEVNIQKNDVIYLFSDGYADQFGGESGHEKFMYPRFREMLMQIGDDCFEKQVQQIEDNFQSWKKEQEQIDDILIIGFKIN